MAKLGDFAPDGLKGDYINRNLKPGQILYLSCDFTTPPKEKYLILVCADTALMFIVNSRIHPYIQNRPALRRSQICLRSTDYDFLPHDSYADCSKVIDELDLTQISAQVNNDLARIKGEITDATKEEIIRVVDNASTIAEDHKRAILSALNKA
jgi:hypothetical protein